MGMKLYKTSEFRSVRAKMLKDAYSASQDFGMSVKELKNSFNMNYSDFRDFLFGKITSDEVVSSKRLWKSYSIESDSQLLAILGKASTAIDNAYTYVNSKNFVLSIDKIDSIVTREVEFESVNWDACGDFYVDFKSREGYYGVCLKFIKADYEVYVKSRGTYESVYNMALITTKHGENINALWTASFMPALYPRILVNHEEFTEICNKCGKRNIKEFKTRQMSAEVCDGMCLVGKNSADLCKIASSMQDEHLAVYDCIKIVAHICKMWENRGNLERKNGKYRREYESAKVHIASKIDLDVDEPKEHIISLSEYSRYERREKKEWQGGHHNSPIEHERRSHKRHYRDANGNIIKVVEVKGSIVNKGNKYSTGKTDSELVYRV